MQKLPVYSQFMKHDYLYLKISLACCLCTRVCATVTSGVSPGHGHGGWHSVCPQIRLAFLMNIIGSDKNI